MRTVQQGGTLSDCLAATGGRTPDEHSWQRERHRQMPWVRRSWPGGEWTRVDRGQLGLAGPVGGGVLLWEPWWVLEKGQIWSMWGVIDGPVIKRNNIYWRNIY